MNYFERIIHKATGVTPGPEMDDLIAVMNCRFSEMSSRQITNAAKRAQRDIRDARSSVAPCKVCETVTHFATKNAAGYCEDCMGDAEIALGNALVNGEITMEVYSAEFAAIHAEFDAEAK